PCGLRHRDSYGGPAARRARRLRFPLDGRGRARAEKAKADYPPTADNGIIGDLHTVALVGTDGTIDWYCCPTFDSPSVFASILDKEKGGYYRIAPLEDHWTSKQLYFPDTNVLITRFFTPGGVGELQGLRATARARSERHRHRLIRRVVAVRGSVRFRV